MPRKTVRCLECDWVREDDEDVAEIHLKIHMDINHERRQTRAVEPEKGEIRRPAHASPATTTSQATRVSELNNQLGSMEETTVHDVVETAAQEPQQELVLAGSSVQQDGADVKAESRPALQVQEGDIAAADGQPGLQEQVGWPSETRIV